MRRSKDFRKDRSRPPARGGDTPQKRPPSRGPERPENWIYGLHAVSAALANPRRKLHRAVLTARAAESLGKELLARVRVEPADLDAISRLLPPGAVHQGAALSCDPLPGQSLDDALVSAAESRRRIVLVLDQLSDPHNVGAILRTAAAFGVSAVVVQDRHAPHQSGALAKAASGALETVPYVEVVNIARALDQLANAGFWRVALAGDGKETLAQAAAKGDIALVLGSEGDGIRRLVREHCDTAAFIPIASAQRLQRSGHCLIRNQKKLIRPHLCATRASPPVHIFATIGFRRGVSVGNLELTNLLSHQRKIWRDRCARFCFGRSVFRCPSSSSCGW
jgi:23S rRNA (guanosine2251-2'-O)-methyltransferase